MCPKLPSLERAPRHEARDGGYPPADTAAPGTWDWRPPVERECPQCGERMIERQWKVVCEKCGASADCTDP